MKITIAFFKDTEWWLAQCKELDIATQARTFEEILGAIGYTLQAHVAVARDLERKPFGGLGPCPDHVWQKCVERAEVTLRDTDE